MQPVFVVLVYLWRWMVTEEEDGRAVHDIHPVDGELLALESEEEANDDDEEGTDGDADAGAGEKYTLSASTPTDDVYDVFPVGRDIEIEDL
jgi:hypothetical protein